MNKDVAIGQRKLRHARDMAVILLIGFALTAWLKVPEALFAAFVAGIGGISGAFVYGNVKNHQADAGKPTVTAQGATSAIPTT